MFKYTKNLLVVLIVLFSCFMVADFVHAQAGDYFIVDQRCWTEKACKESEGGGIFYGPNNETIKACGIDKDPSEVNIGWCRPHTEAKTQISFSGTNRFLHFGELIQWIFRYGVLAAGIFAVVMIVIAGLSWIMSAGNPERITSSKKRLGNAMMGFFITILIYFVLYTINPYLVNLRLPQVWKINSLGLSPPFCDEVDESVKLAPAFKAGEKLTEKQKADKYSEAVGSKLFKSVAFSDN